jgi:hypothetical protein
MLRRSQHRRAVWPKHVDPAGVKERSGLHRRGSPGTWEILVSPSRRREGRRESGPGPRESVLSHAEANTSTTTVTVRPKATKGAGMDTRKSERPVVLLNPENQPNGIRWREGVAGTRNCWRER